MKDKVPYKVLFPKSSQFVFITFNTYSITVAAIWPSCSKLDS